MLHLQIHCICTQQTGHGFASKEVLHCIAITAKPEYSIIRILIWLVGIRLRISRFFQHLASPTKRFSFALEYESPMSECHDSVHLEEKTKMPKTSAVREHFKLSEDKTKAGAWWKQNSNRYSKLAFAAKHLLYVRPLQLHQSAFSQKLATS